MINSSPIRQPRIRKPSAVLLVLILLGSYLPSQTDYTFHAETELVLVNVTVRDKSGKVVRDMKPEDFQIKEDGKSQQIVSFDIENTDAVPTLDVAQAKPLENSPPGPSPNLREAATRRSGRVQRSPLDRAVLRSFWDGT
jgi:hypothetical protein